MSIPLALLAEGSEKANAKTYIENNNISTPGDTTTLSGKGVRSISVDTKTSGNKTTKTVTTSRNSKGYTATSGYSNGEKQETIKNNNNGNNVGYTITVIDAAQVTIKKEGVKTIEDVDFTDNEGTITVVNPDNNNSVKRSGSKKGRDSTTTITKDTGKTKTTKSGKK